MLFLVVFALLHLPSIKCSSVLESHLSENLKLKCDALPYRSTFADDQCYFAVLREVDYSKAAEQCSSILAGATVATKVYASIFSAMMVDKSKFHLDSSSTGSKYTICFYDSAYKCASGQSIQSAGRCLVRSPRKMTFNDADNYCKELGMELPGPANDLDNRIVRDAIVKDPVWVDRRTVRENKFSWRQARDYSRWTTCPQESKQSPPLYAGSQSQPTCAADMASVVDRSGYWSNGAVKSLMDAICVKNADNVFTKGEASACDYHSKPDPKKNVCQLGAAHTPSLASMMSTCYTPTRSTTRYEVLDRAIVDTKRGCEVLCNAKSTCTGFALKDAGLTSSCALLSTSKSGQNCDTPSTIFLKKTSGCAARTNMTEEFGEDPCIDSRHDEAFQGYGRRICPVDKNNLYIVRAIDANGCRITLDNELHNTIIKADNMWQFNHYFDSVAIVVPIVAATCALAGGDKCPCEPLKHLPIKDQPQYPAIPEVMNPCNTSAVFWLYFDFDKSEEWSKRVWGVNFLSRPDSKASFVTCKAGVWMIWKQSNQNIWGVTGAACIKCTGPC